MARNFGIPDTTTRATVGGNQSRGPHIDADTRADNVIQLASRSSPARLNSRSKEVEPFLSEFELGSSLLFLFVVLAPIAIVGGVVIGYLALVPEFVQH